MTVATPRQAGDWEAWYAADRSGRTMTQDFGESKYDAMRRAFLAGAEAKTAPSATTGRAVYEVWRAAIPNWVCNVPGGEWEDLAEPVQAGFAAIAAREPGAADDLAEVVGVLREALGDDRDAEPENGEAPATHAVRLAHYLKERITELHGLIADPEPQPAPDLAGDLLANIDGLHTLIRDIFQSLPDTADEPEWRDRAGALHVCDPDGQPYRALTEEDM
jgi:hypothetical protein